MANGIEFKIENKKLPQSFVLKAAELQGRIGILAAKQHKDSDFTIASLAAVHEWGSLDGKIPERSFFRLTQEKKKAEFEKFIKKNENKIVEAILAGTFEVTLKKLVAKWEAYIHECFETEGWGTWEDLQDSTLAARVRKGNTTAMILQDTGELEKHIVSEVK